MGEEKKRKEKCMYVGVGVYMYKSCLKLHTCIHVYIIYSVHQQNTYRFPFASALI